MAINVFVDSNVYLSFYELSNADIKELEKIPKLIDEKVITLYVNQLLKDEWKRNRGKTLRGSLDKFEKCKISSSYPLFCKDYQKYNEIRKIEDAFNKAKSDLKDEMIKHINDFDLKADIMIDKIFKHASEIDITEDILKESRLRKLKGNPPSMSHKENIGDSVHWISLLKKAPSKEKLYFISNDSHFSSDFDSSKISELLREEWIKEKSSEIVLFKSLSDFFRRHLPEKVSLSNDLEIIGLTEELANSGTYSQTHEVMKKLDGFKILTPHQAQDLLEAAMSNSQVLGIACDEDVLAFFKRMVKLAKPGLDRFSKDKLNEVLDFYSKVEFRF